MRLERSRTDSKLFGLCGGIARTAGIHAVWLRWAFVIGALMTGGTLFFLYILASMIIPKEPAYSAYYYGWSPEASEIQELRAKLARYEK